MSRATRAIIDLSALEHNLSLLQDINETSKVIAVIKADAYGNGAVQVAKQIADRVDLFAVAFLDEAIELRVAGITLPIVILQGPHSTDDFTDAQRLNVIWVMHERWQLEHAKNLKQRGKLDQNKIWLKFDTGMHRLGFPISEFEAITESYKELLEKDSTIVTHLACADDISPAHAEHQIQTFLQAVESSPFSLCIANSATNMRFENARKDFVRLGIALYGSTPFPKSYDKSLSLSSVMTLESEIMAIRRIPKGDFVGYGATWQAKRESLIATVALGYADGYPRHAPSGTPAWCKGRLIPLVGRVSMDMLTFDVTDMSYVEVGDKVELWGKHLPINDVADHIGTIGYELMTRISKRVPRVYISTGIKS